MALTLDIISILAGSKSCGINIWIKPDDELVIDVLVIKKIGNKLSIIKKISTPDFDQLKNLVPKGTPIYISIDGKGVLHKIVELNSELPLIEHILPNADISDFIIQSILLDENRSIVSAIRNERIEEVIKRINSHGFDVLKVFLGPFSMAEISSILSEETFINIPYYKILLKNKSLVGFERNMNDSSDFNLNTESDIVESNFIIPFSNSLYHFGNNNLLSIDNPLIKQQHENFHYKRLFQLCGWVFLTIMFISLLINYFLLDHYRQKNQLLITQIENNKEVIDRIEKIRLQVKIREDFYKNNHSYESPLFAYYSDRIAKDIPLGISLNRLCLSPVRKSLPGKEILEFQKNVIIISGNTNNSASLDTWIRKLKSLNWIRDISIKDFKDNGSEPAKFDLEIGINELKK